jgi:hypothetical protein
MTTIIPETELRQVYIPSGVKKKAPYMRGHDISLNLTVFHFTASPYLYQRTPLVVL